MFNGNTFNISSNVCYSPESILDAISFVYPSGLAIRRIFKLHIEYKYEAYKKPVYSIPCLQAHLSHILGAFQLVDLWTQTKIF